MRHKIAVMGAGSWGTALAVSIAANGHDVMLWGRDSGYMKLISENRENRKYLPDVKLGENIHCTSDAGEAVSDADIVMFAVPAQSFRVTLASVEHYIDNKKSIDNKKIIVNCAKGIETDTLKRISEIAAEIRPDLPFVVLSGPSHAEEAGRFLPTTLVSASKDQHSAMLVQDVMMSESMRVYTNEDVIGVEIGGALKNIIALAAGISDGMEYGDNAKAALMTRGLAEISRLGVRLGGDKLTFMGLAGLGDLIVTCTSMHSRNRRCGILIGQGVEPDRAAERIGMVVEGMYTTRAAYAMSVKYGVEMPVTEQLYRMIRGDVSGADAVRNLMLRKRRDESED